jgi:hypothetical protein
MLFVDNIVLVDESRIGVNSKFELQQQTLESMSLRISRRKTEYIECKFSIGRNTDQSIILDGKTISVEDYFRYLESIIQKDGELDGDVEY